MSRIAWSDVELLTALHLCDGLGLSRQAAADVLSRRFRRPINRMAVVGHLARINAAADAERCACTRPENRDGGMPPLWWAGALLE